MISTRSSLRVMTCLLFAVVAGQSFADMPDSQDRMEPQGMPMMGPPAGGPGWGRGPGGGGWDRGRGPGGGWDRGGGWGRGPDRPPVPPPQPPPYGPPYGPPPPPPPPPYRQPMPPPIPPTMPLFVDYNGRDFLVTLDGSEGARTGYPVQTQPFSIFQAPPPQAVALYRCVSFADHFTSIAPNCEGMVVEGLLGYLSSVPMPYASRPVYRCSGINHGNSFHFTTADINVCIIYRLNVDQTMGYVP